MIAHNNRLDYENDSFNLFRLKDGREIIDIAKDGTKKTNHIPRTWGGEIAEDRTKTIVSQAKEDLFNW